MRRAWLVTGVVLLVTTPALADTIELPTPESARVQQAKLIQAVGGRPDRLLVSDVPGPVVNDEVVRVGIGGDGSVASVTDDQRLTLRGEGDYAIRERGPVRSATSLSADPPPVTRRGAVVWQGFSPGRRDLAARLALDPQIESTRLPLTVRVTFAPTAGRPVALEPGGRVSGPGVVSITVANATEQPAVLPTARDVDALRLAGPLDRALAVARRPSAAWLPSTAAGLPGRLEVVGRGSVETTQAVPLRLTGSLTAIGTAATFSGPSVRPDGSFAGTLGGSRAGTTTPVTFTATLAGAGRLALDLTAVTALNATELQPPRQLPTWTAWAASGPPAAERRAALDLLVAVAATGARAASYAPYLGADLEGSGSTSFRYSFAPAPPPRVAAPAPEPRWWAIALVGLVALLVLVGGVALWRRS